MDRVEKWVAVPGYEGRYEVSDRGAVRSCGFTFRRSDGKRYTRAGTTLAPIADSSGHLGVVLYGDRSRHRHPVHRLVLLAFVGPPPAGLEACHADDDPTHNDLRNLRWGTRSENRLDAVRNGRHYQASQTTCKRGHPFTAENTYRNDGRRHCRTCRRGYRVGAVGRLTPTG